MTTLRDAAQQEPVAWPHVWGCRANAAGECDKGCTAPQPVKREPLTDEEFLQLLLKKGTTELVSWTTFVGESIQMQGKIGLRRGAKLLKEFVESAHGITKE